MKVIICLDPLTLYEMPNLMFWEKIRTKTTNVSQLNFTVLKVSAIPESTWFASPTTPPLFYLAFCKFSSTSSSSSSFFFFFFFFFLFSYFSYFLFFLFFALCVFCMVTIVMTNSMKTPILLSVFLYPPYPNSPFMESWCLHYFLLVRTLKICYIETLTARTAHFW